MKAVRVMAVMVSLLNACSSEFDPVPSSTGSGGQPADGGGSPTPPVGGGPPAEPPNPLSAADARPDELPCSDAAGAEGLLPHEWMAAQRLSPLPPLPADPTNKVADNPAAATLGQMLFFDKRYSGPLAVGDDGHNGGLGMVMQAGKINCASCHMGPGLADPRSKPGTVSLGADWLGRNSLSLVNASFYTWVNWAGRFSAQWELSLPVAENPKNMNSDRLKIAHLIFDQYRYEYEAVFGPVDPALGGDPVRFPPSGKPKANAMAADGAWEAMTDADRLTVNWVFVNYGKALAAYMRRLVSRESRFDRFVAGPGQLTPYEIAGFKLFVGKAGCTYCHNGPHFTDNRFHALGVPQTGERVPAMDLGRYTDLPALLGSPFNSAGSFSDDPMAGRARLANLSAMPQDILKGQFRTPSLRGVALTAPYMHAGQLPSLEAVIDFYDKGGGGEMPGVIRPPLRRLGLTPDEKAQLVAFLGTLTPDPLPAALGQDTSKQ